MKHLQQIAQNMGMIIECGPVGNKNSEIAIIIESPNESDIKLGIPLSSSNGSMLFKCLEKYNIYRKDVYITCAIKRKIPVIADKFRFDGTELLTDTCYKGRI